MSARDEDALAVRLDKAEDAIQRVRDAIASWMYSTDSSIDYRRGWSDGNRAMSAKAHEALAAYEAEMEDAT